jgi:hypothetical protein
VDSTELKLCGAGEWLVEKHGTRTRRSWRRLHLGVDADTGQIVAAALTNKEADDRLSGLVPDRITENEIMRRYALPRSLALRYLARMAREGWAERLPGKGWAFLPVLTSAEAYRMAYEFRIVIEPAAILQSSFTIDEAALRRARQQQQSLLEGEYRTLSRTRLFEINSQFHGLLFLLLFGVRLGWLPVVGYVFVASSPVRGLLYLIMPVAMRMLHESGVLVRMARASTLGVLRLDYVTHARAKGLSEFAVLRRQS